MSLFEPRCILVTGGAGFIGSNFIRWLLARTPDIRVVNLDALTYAGNLDNLSDVVALHGDRGDGRYFFLQGDIRNYDTVACLLRGEASESSGGHATTRAIPAADCIVHLAAESHVDRSIMGPAAFVDTNVRGTLTLLEAWRGERALRNRPFRFVHVSTDEVYGTLGRTDPAFTETTPLAPNSPYSASKAASDLLVRAHVETFGFPAIITRCSNNYGPFQFPEKLIPLMITRALADQPLPIYGDGENVRDWLYVEDHAAAIWRVLTHGRLGEVYNIGGNTELPNIVVVRKLLRLLGRPESLITFVTDRPGHDRRYAINAGKLTKELGWHPHHTFETGLEATVNWYLNHRAWWKCILDCSYGTSGTFQIRDHQ